MSITYRDYGNKTYRDFHSIAQARLAVSQLHESHLEVFRKTHGH